MQIALDVTVLGRTRKTGVEAYTRGVVEAALPLWSGAAVTLCALGGAPLQLQWPAAAGPAVRRAPWMPPRVYRTLLRAHLAPRFDHLLGTRFDAAFFPDFVLPPLARRTRAAVVVHDLAFAMRPEFVPARNRAYLTDLVRRSVQRATVVVAVSEFTRQELAAHYGLDPATVRVISPAVDPQRFRPRSPVETTAARARYGLEGPYVLFRGTVEPRKNVANVIRAFEALPAAVRGAHTLALVGGRGWLDGGIQAALRNARAGGAEIRALGYVPDADVPFLDAAASAFVFPSHYEGFGMPVLEALASGAPVITSRVSALPEVAGDAALLVDPDDVQGLAATLGRVLEDRALAADLRARGPVRARAYRWETSGERLVNLMRDLGRS